MKKQISATVIKIEPYTPRYTRMRLHAPEIAPHLQAGQFIMARCGAGVAPYLRRMLYPCRAYSETGEASPTKLDVVFYPDEPGLNWLRQLPPNAELDVLGVLGRGFTLDAATRRLLLIAQDDHIIPLLAVLGEARIRGIEIVLMTENTTAETVFPPALLPRKVEYSVATLDGSWGYHGSVWDIVGEAVAWADQLGAAGERSWYTELQRVVETKKFKLPRGFAQVVLHAPLACGMGVCMGCAVETARGMRQVCVDGPVFDLRDGVL